ncbi:MAG: caspase family protein, partial [Gammaproteobacteria bacterium]
MHASHDGFAAIVRVLFVVSIIFLQVSCANSPREPKTETGKPVSTDNHQPQSPKLALLVGLDKYQHKHIGNLNGAVNDVRSMKRLLVERFDFPDDDEYLRVLTNSKATREAILKGIEEHLIAKADSNSIVVFHYSGHGSYLRDAQGEETDGRDETIVPYDSGHIDPYPNRDISDDELNALLHKLADKTPHVTFIFDSCHSGTAIRGAGLARTTRPDDRPPPTRLHAAGSAARGLSEGPNDLRPRHARYALISGAMAQELSYELQMDGKSYG